MYFLSQWRGIVEHLEEMQMAQLEGVIDKVRQELVILWDKCMLGPEQREPFSIHFCDGTLHLLLGRLRFFIMYMFSKFK